MSTITVFVDSNLLSTIINILNGSIKFNFGESDSVRRVSLKKTRKYPFEVQLPIATLSQFFPKDNYATINLIRFKDES